MARVRPPAPTADITLYIGDAPKDDIEWEFKDHLKWEAVRRQIEAIVMSPRGTGFLRIPSDGGGSMVVVITPETKINWRDRLN